MAGMKLPRFRLLTLFLFIAAIAAFLAYWLNRGWTVAKVERLIQAEFNPDWQAADVKDWIESHGFDADQARDIAGTKPYGSIRAPSLPDEPQFVVRGYIGPEHGSNIGPFHRGGIFMFFFFDSVGRFVKREVTSYRTDDPRMPRKPHEPSRTASFADKWQSVGQ